jgi:hypothetical protein
MIVDRYRVQDEVAIHDDFAGLGQRGRGAAGLGCRAGAVGLGYGPGQWGWVGGLACGPGQRGWDAGLG